MARDPDSVIRPATPDDVPALAVLFHDYRQFYGEAFARQQTLDFVQEHVSKQNTQFLVARAAEAALLGFVHLIPSFNTLALRPIWFLEDLFVVPSARRTGIASALMTAAEAFAIKSGAERLTLATAHDNLAAQALYRKLGYLREEHFIYFHRFLP